MRWEEQSSSRKKRMRDIFSSFGTESLFSNLPGKLAAHTHDYRPTRTRATFICILSRVTYLGERKL